MSVPIKTPTFNDLSFKKLANNSQLDNIKAHLDLILLSLESLADITSETILNAAKELKLNITITNRVEFWRLRQANPLRKSSGGRKKLDVEEAKSLVLIICYIAYQHQELIRRAVTLLEDTTAQNQPLHRVSLLGDYLDKFTNTYQDRMQEDNISPEKLQHLALKLLIDLLFYSSTNGHRRLWLALLDYSKIKK